MPFEIPENWNMANAKQIPKIHWNIEGKIENYVK